MKETTGTQLALPPRVSALLEHILEEYPVHKNHVHFVLGLITEEELRRFEQVLSFYAEHGFDLSHLAACYLTVVEDTLTEQLFFRKHGRYRYSSYADVAGHVYEDRDYMTRYLVGLVVTAFLWPNHLRMGRFFAETLPRSARGRYLEVGPGHGYYFTQAMALSSYESFLGVDISETSVELTRGLVDFVDPTRRKPYGIEHADFLCADFGEELFAAIVMGEVLEHVERPQDFLRHAATLAVDDAHIYVTTCTNSPAIDHIYLFPNPAAVEDMMSDCGLSVQQKLVLPPPGKSVAASLEQKLPINVAYVLEKSP